MKTENIGSKFLKFIGIVSLLIMVLGCTGGKENPALITSPDEILTGSNSSDFATSPRTEQYAEATHRDILTEYIVQFYVAKYPGDTEFVDFLTNSAYGGQYKTSLKNGSYDEDSPWTRSLNHFMTPVSQTAFPTSPTDFKKCTDWLSGSYNALEWALGFTGSGTANTLTFQASVSDFQSGNPLNGFDKLGHVLHLNQDMAVPAHVRNDGHPPIIDPDTYEDWTAKSGFPAYAQYLYNNHVAGLRKINPGISINVDSTSVLQAAYDLAVKSGVSQYQSYPGVSALFWFTSWTTNQTAFSTDTIGQSTHNSPDTSNVPAITSYTAVQNPGDGKWSAKFYWTPEIKLKNTLIRMGILAPADFPFLVAV
ncbi:MAG: hypothetical protein ABIC40_00670, partial [bacterium]